MINNITDYFSSLSIYFVNIPVLHCQPIMYFPENRYKIQAIDNSDTPAWKNAPLKSPFLKE